MVTDQVIRMAFVRALLQLQLDVLVHAVAHFIQDPVAPRWTTSVIINSSLVSQESSSLSLHHSLHIVVVCARLKLKCGRECGRPFQHLVEGPLLVHHQLQLVPLDQCAQLVCLHHVPDLLGRCRRLSRQPEVQVPKPEHVTAKIGY